MKLIKICDVQNIYEARSLGELGVNFVGLHYISENDQARADDLKDIIRMYHRDYPTTQSIMVTKETSIEKLVALLEEFECDGLQLHFPASASLFAQLRSRFGSKLVLFGVAAVGSEASAATYDRADYIILDKSYRGGTGSPLTEHEMRRFLDIYDSQKVFLAGGVNVDVITQTRAEQFAGYDIQSAVKSSVRQQFENIDWEKARYIMKAIKRKPLPPAFGQVGVSCRSEDDPLDFYGMCDFWHFDFFDRMFESNTDVPTQIQNIQRLTRMNSHIRVQIHIFSTRPEYIRQIIAALRANHAKGMEFYLHQNPQTAFSMVIDQDIYPSLDTKDVMGGNFPLGKHLSKGKIILCLQSEKHLERGANVNMAIKLIHQLWNKNPDITIDRAILPGDITYAADMPVDIVSGRYLRQHGKDGLEELKRSLEYAR